LADAQLIVAEHKGGGEFFPAAFLCACAEDWAGWHGEPAALRELPLILAAFPSPPENLPPAVTPANSAV
jgi:hypothetical protein